MMTIYHVTATRDGKWWALQCQEFPGALSQATRLDQAPGMIREAIAFVAQVPEDSFDIEVIPVLPDAFLREQEAMVEARDQSRVLNSKAAQYARSAVKVLVDAGLPVRDVGTIMGVSYQRAAQLASA